MKKYDLSGFQILEFEELDSTNTKAAELLKGGLEDRSVVLTFRQTKGKGQVGNSWESEAGKNISITGCAAVCRIYGDCFRMSGFYS